MRTRALLLAVVVALPLPLGAQARDRIGLRAGAGVDRTGRVVYSGQIDFIEASGNSAVELAITGFDGTLKQDYFAIAEDDRRHRYRERTDVLGGALHASWMPGYSLDSGGPYLTLGLGLGGFQTDWVGQSPTDRFMGPLVPGVGYRSIEHTLELGCLLSVGLGFRLHDLLDVRAQLPTAMIPSTKRRDLKLVPAIAFTLGIGL
jgi:hypothetical protein